MRTRTTCLVAFLLDLILSRPRNLVSHQRPSKFAQHLTLTDCRFLAVQAELQFLELRSLLQLLLLLPKFSVLQFVLIKVKRAGDFTASARIFANFYSHSTVLELCAAYLRAGRLARILPYKLPACSGVDQPQSSISTSIVPNFQSLQNAQHSLAAPIATIPQCPVPILPFLPMGAWDPMTTGFPFAPSVPPSLVPLQFPQNLLDRKARVAR